MYIVTGGAGFIGSAMVWKLNEMGIDDILVVDNLGTSEKWKNLVNRRFSDYLNRTAFLEMVGAGQAPAPTAVLHMGACSSTTETDAEFLMENNYRYSRLLCQWALENNARFVGASSAATYGDGSQGFKDDVATMAGLKPLNMYGYTKQLFDLWANRSGALKQIASLKFFNVYGPNEYHKEDMRSVICKAFSQINESGRLKLFKSYRKDYPDGGQLRDFVYVKDCVDVMWWLLEHPNSNGLFNVGTGGARTWNDLAKAVFKAMGKPAKIDYIDMPPSLREKYQYFTESDMERLQQADYKQPFATLEDGVKDYVENYLASEDPYL